LSDHHAVELHVVTDHERTHPLHPAGIIARMIDELKAAGNRVTKAHFHGGDGCGVEDLLTPREAAAAGVFAASAAASAALALTLLAALLPPVPAAAADLPVRAVLRDAPAVPACSQAGCTGFRAGINIAGTGSSLDVLGSGLGGSVFAGGGGLGLDLGYQYWDSKWYFAVGAFGDYVFQNPAAGSAAAPSPGYLFGEFVDIGMPISALFGQTPAAPSGLPSTILNALLAPYVKVGALERPWGTAWATGAGAAFVISSNWLLNVDYIHAQYANAAINPSTSQQTDNLIKVTASYKF